MDDGDEWKYQCDGEPLTPEQVKRFAVTRDRLLVSSKVSDYPFETVVYETSPKGDYIKLGFANAWSATTQWVRTDSVNLISVLARPKPQEVGIGD